MSKTRSKFVYHDIQDSFYTTHTIELLWKIHQIYMKITSTTFWECKSFKNRGIKMAFSKHPFLPCLTDYEKNVENLIVICQEVFCIFNSKPIEHQQQQWNFHAWKQGSMSRWKMLDFTWEWKRGCSSSFVHPSIFKPRNYSCQAKKILLPNQIREYSFNFTIYHTHKKNILGEEKLYLTHVYVPGCQWSSLQYNGKDKWGNWFINNLRIFQWTFFLFDWAEEGSFVYSLYFKLTTTATTRELFSRLQGS